jgi:hypothetical protein
MSEHEAPPRTIRAKTVYTNTRDQKLMSKAERERQKSSLVTYNVKDVKPDVKN